jgi:hypothetical protein
MLGDSLIHERVDQDAGMFGLYQLGWDFDHFWGTEARFGFASVDVAANDEGSEPGSSENLSWDVNLVHYPWGDSRWRPFLSAGFGLASFRFGDDDGQPVYETLYTIPLGCGVKYFYRPWLGLRFAVTDQLALGAYRLATMHNVCFAGGVEVRFGGARTSYYPYDTGTKWW